MLDLMPRSYSIASGSISRFLFCIRFLRLLHLHLRFIDRSYNYNYYHKITLLFFLKNPVRPIEIKMFPKRRTSFRPI